MHRDRSALAPGTIGLGLAVHPGDVPSAMRQMRHEARAAVAAGFDGVTLSEHHAGFPGYLPNPALISAMLTAELDRGWAVAAPAILPLRDPVPVAEDLAWLASCHPGRVAAGFVAGYQQRDFIALGRPFTTRTADFWAALARVSELLSGAAPDHPVANDVALTGLTVASRPPLVVGVGGPKGAARAARAGVGLLVTSLTDPATCARLVGQYRAQGGGQVCCLIRRIWAGERATMAAPTAAWSGAGGGAAWLTGAEQELLTGDPAMVVDCLVRVVAESGASALNIRINVDGKGPVDMLRQIDLLGERVLPALRDALSW